MRPAVWAALALTGFLSGCSTAYSMSISGGLERPTAVFNRAGMPFDVCLSSLEVWDRSDGTPRGRLVWEIRAAGECVTLDRIAYGAAPTGFTSVHAAEALKPGVVYEALGQGAATGLFAAAAYGGGRFTYHDGNWWQPSGRAQ